MTSVLLCIIYAGIADGFADKHGFWKSLVWPYFAGLLLADAIERKKLDDL
ncbi:hypothetical protein L905_19040 [Agrobacterium sp. TS43]|nr:MULTISPECIES: hypothetical protein [Agrobacterium]KVK49488.1 hypothetical protein L903_19395 [Agrobacterium sp. JL28]KVK49725.1 hypothetical protein L904_19385 [Agrobacterium sp. LY4]KVK62667.1 hypothetical protein L906_18515 [Agrobacterium sp. TS45]KVK65052.1 hypothetical protein L905_19040 [Agrobacterium sp. TS43]KVK67117.1 hypothetical protein L907_18490 [Agrobacterium sp. C13]